MTWILRASKKFLTVNPTLFAELGCKGLSSSLGNQMVIQTAGTALLSISYWLVLSFPIIISDKYPKDPAHHIGAGGIIKFLSLDCEC